MLKYFISILSLCFISQPCFSQVVKEQVTLQFVSFPKLANGKPVELFIGDGKTMKVELPTNHLSPEYKVDAQQVWSIGKSSTGEEGEFKFETYGKATALSF